MGISDYVIAFSVVNGALEKVAEDEAGFERHDGRWLTSAGPGVPVDVETFHGSGWKGMRATLACGIFDPESGPHTG